MEPLTIRLFGGLEATINGIALPRLHLREGERLLAYLTLHHETPLAYRDLARLFWPSEALLNEGYSGDFPNTRQAIRSLRLALGDQAARLHSPSKGVVALQLAEAAVDVLAFDRLVAEEGREAWQAALAYYRGPLLAGWSEPWAVEARTRRKRSLERILRRLVESLLADGEFAQAESCLLLGMEQGEAQTWGRELMRLQAGQGRLADCEETYERLCAELATHASAPDVETRQLMETLREQTRRAPLVALLPHPPTPSPTRGEGENRNREPLPNATSSVMEREGEAEAITPETAEMAAPPADAPLVVLVYKRNAQPDEALMRLLEKALQAAGYRVFVDRHMPVGIAWATEIETQVRRAYAVIPLLSAASVRSEMLEHEIQVANEAAQQQKGTPRILPVRVAYTDPLPAQTLLATLLTPLHCAFWNGPEDDDTLVSQLLRALQTAPVLPEHLRLEPAGGAVALDSRFYVVRDTDQIVTEAMRRSESIVLIKGARQMGKTSLLARGLQQARDAGAQVALTDLQTLNAAQLQSPDALYRALATAIALQLDLDVSVKEQWDPDFGANMNLEIFLRRHILSRLTQPFVWGLDEVDRLFACSFGSDLFGLFRSWHNRRSLEPTGPWSRLTLAMAYATEAHLFITDLNQSPFNVGTRVALEDFSREQVADLNARYGGPLRNPEELGRLYDLVNGQPYLVRRALDTLVETGMGLTCLEQEADRDEGPFGDHLRRLLALLAQNEELAEVARGLLRGEPCPTPDSFYRLRSAGVMAGEWGRTMRLRCRLYALYLGRHLLA